MNGVDDFGNFGRERYHELLERAEQERFANRVNGDAKHPFAAALARLGELVRSDGKPEAVDRRTATQEVQRVRG